MSPATLRDALAVLDPPQRREVAAALRSVAARNPSDDSQLTAGPRNLGHWGHRVGGRKALL